MMRFALPRLLSRAFVPVLLSLFGFAHAQDFPNKPLRLIIPYPAGGARDLTARALGGVADEYLAQPMSVVVRAGGGGANPA